MGSLLKSTYNTRSILPDSVRFVRSDVPAALTVEEVEWLLKQKITTLVDLRSDAERAAVPCALESDDRFYCIHLPVTGGNRIPDCPEDVPKSYVRMVDGQMERILETILYAPSNVLYFCSAGKDRTGVVSALLLRHMGITDRYIIEDYMRSGENLEQQLLAFSRRHPEIDPEVIMPRSAYMEEFLKKIPVG